MTHAASTSSTPDGAVARAFRLVHDIQAAIPGAEDELDELAAEALRNGWSEVARACIFGRTVRAWIGGDPSVGEIVNELIDDARSADDTTMLALGLALRSDQGFAGIANESSDDDLAQAITLLEQSSGGVLERISGHTACAIALGNRWLFELSDAQYAAALAIGEPAAPGELDFILAPIMFNLAENQVSWGALLYGLRDEVGVRARLSRFRDAELAVARYETPEAWLAELESLRLCLAAMAGEDVAEMATELLSRLDKTALRPIGILRLAVALADISTGRSPATGEAAALAALDPDVHPHLYDLALLLEATVAARSGGSAGLRYGQRLLGEQWTRRNAALGAMESRIRATRLAAEREVLSRHARLDDLTGVGNRRALDRFFGELVANNIAEVAIVLFDVDAFKTVNDRFGHLVGDTVLVRLAAVLESDADSGNLVVRLGGDEFLVALAGVGLDAASACAEQIFAAIDQIDFSDVAPGLVVSVSAGVAAGVPDDVVGVRGQADRALYRAKAAGGHGIDRTDRPEE